MDRLACSLIRSVLTSCIKRAAWRFIFVYIHNRRRQSISYELVWLCGFGRPKQSSSLYSVIPIAILCQERRDKCDPVHCKMKVTPKNPMKCPFVVVAGAAPIRCCTVVISMNALRQHLKDIHDLQLEDVVKLSFESDAGATAQQSTYDNYYQLKRYFLTFLFLSVPEYEQWLNDEKVKEVFSLRMKNSKFNKDRTVETIRYDCNFTGSQPGKRSRKEMCQRAPKGPSVKMDSTCPMELVSSDFIVLI